MDYSLVSRPPVSDEGNTGEIVGRWESVRPRGRVIKPYPFRVIGIAAGKNADDPVGLILKRRFQLSLVGCAMS